MMEITQPKKGNSSYSTIKCKKKKDQVLCIYCQIYHVYTTRPPAITPEKKINVDTWIIEYKRSELNYSTIQDKKIMTYHDNFIGAREILAPLGQGESLPIFHHSKFS